MGGGGQRSGRMTASVVRPIPLRDRSETNLWYEEGALYCVGREGSEDERIRKDGNRDGIIWGVADGEGQQAGGTEEFGGTRGRGSAVVGACEGRANLCMPGGSGPEAGVGLEGTGGGTDGRGRETDCAPLCGADLEARGWQRGNGEKGERAGRAEGKRDSLAAAYGGKSQGRRRIPPGDQHSTNPHGGRAGARGQYLRFIGERERSAESLRGRLLFLRAGRELSANAAALLPLFSRINLKNACIRLEDLGYSASLLKIQAIRNRRNGSS